MSHPRCGTVLVVDDLPGSAALMSRVLVANGHRVIAVSSGEEALDTVRRRPPDVIVMDVRMPGISGIEACRQLKRGASTRLLPVILVTAQHGGRDRLEGIKAGADDFLTKPVDAVELRARVASLIRLKRYTDDLESAESVIVSLALTIEARDASTQGHCARLAAYATALGRRLGLARDEIAALERGGYLHDVGKVGIPDAVLLKAGPLDRAEYAVMKMHTTIGDRLCGELRSLGAVRPIVRYHHERLDGSGYPDALRGDAIPLLAQIMSVVDVYDALRSARPYKAAVTRERALEELAREAAMGWRSRELVDAFAAIEQNARAVDGVPPAARDEAPVA